MTFTWTNEKETELKSLWQKGYSARQIADKMGGVSRNAVIGKAHRLGLSQRIAPPKREFLTPHFARERLCQWPFGDPQKSDFHFCGKDVEGGKPYCAHHCSRAYRRLTILEADRELSKSQMLLKIS
ncbi:MAG: GcrA family cell cycle regulator [Hydrotalea sp.]|nr:GcrA family cell cycle regulator [Hydrotalea sp.]